MLDILSNLTPTLGVLLFLSLFLVLFFEFINGFHDTANAIATVIYTQSMKPTHAVVASGIFNFLGVVTGGLAVAYAIVNLLPVDLLASGDSKLLISMIFALLLGAIIWNLGTWYFGLPASSSHTLIGSILGVGVANAMFSGQSWSEGVNWGKAMDVGASLLFSPLAGFLLAFITMSLLRQLFPTANIHQTPYLRSGVRGKKHPPFWTRFMLILSAMGVSFAHGSNDGQKGVGLVMLILICIIPGHFLLNMKSSQYQLERAVTATVQLERFMVEHKAELDKVLPPPVAQTSADKVHCQASDTAWHAKEVQTLLPAGRTIADLTENQRWMARSHLLCLENTSKKVAALPMMKPEQKEYLNSLQKDFSLPIEYAPIWVIFAIASALGLGTMVGWKRVVKTVGEGIGKSHMTYAQGVSAQMTTAIGIASANLFGLPVSTTQILSSAVAGTAVANKSGLQWSTIRNIVLAWLFTFPIAMLLSGGLFALFHFVFG